MNDIYRYQRHVYDITRTAFLFGRDTLLRRMQLDDGDRVLEVGCGTARNLLKLHAMNDTLALFGIDASTEMLTTARANLTRRKLQSRIRVAHGLAQDLCPAATFGVSEFDTVFFSYSLSMIPSSTRSIDAALDAVRPGGSIYIVDFCDQAAFHPLVRKPLRAWLGLFGVEHRPSLYVHLARLSAEGRGELTTEVFGNRYGIWARFQTVPR